MQKKIEHTITNTSIVRRIPNQVFSEIDGEIAMLCVKKGEYLNFNEVASDIWGHLNDPKKYQEILKYLSSKYQVSKEQCEKNTKSYLLELFEYGLIDIENE